MSRKAMSTIIAVIIAVLIGSNIYFWNECRKPAYEVRIGTPAIGKQINYGAPLKDKKEAYIIQFELMHAQCIEKPAITDKAPDAIIRIDNWKNEGIYIYTEVWFEGEKVILEDSLVYTQYKELKGEHAKEIKRLILKHSNT